MEIQKICHRVNLLQMFISHCAFCPQLWEAGSKRLNTNVFGDVFSFQKCGSYDQIPNNWNCTTTLPLSLTDEIFLVFLSSVFFTSITYYFFTWYTPTECTDTCYLRTLCLRIFYTFSHDTFTKSTEIKSILWRQDTGWQSPYFLLSADLNLQGLEEGKEFLQRSQSRKSSLQKGWLDHFGL